MVSRSFLLALFLTALALASPCLLAGQTPPAAAPPAGTVQASPDPTAPVPVPAPSPEALRYYRSGNLLWIVETLWGFLVPLLLLFTGFSARLRDQAARIGRGRYRTFALYFLFFALLTYLLHAPLSFYSEYVRQHAYGLSNQTFGKWLGDGLKTLAIGALVGAASIRLPYLLLEKSPRRWWIYLGALSAPLLALLLLVLPIWFDPLFNRFGPLTDETLETKILTLAERAGIEGSRVFEVDKSTDTETVNAYVKGFLASKRIVLWDTLLEKFEEREILFVMGHEMGHFVLGHNLQLIALGTALSFFCLYVVHRSSAALLGRFGGRFGFSTLSDVASLPLVLLLSNLAVFLVLPGILAFTRYNERESDRFGLELTRDNRAAALAFVKLQGENLGNPYPGPLYKLWRASHPPLGERIDFCNRYRPWETGEPLRYGDRIDRP